MLSLFFTRVASSLQFQRSWRLFFVSLTCLLLIKTGAGPAHAQSPDHDSIQSFCRELVAIDIKTRRVAGREALIDLLRVVFDRSYFAQADIDKIFAPKVNPGRVKLGRNLIFAMGPTPGIPPEALEAERAELRRVQKELQADETRLLKIVGATTQDGCVTKAVKAQFEPNRFFRLKEQEQSLLQAHQLLEGALVEKNFHKIKDKLYLNWELIRPTGLEELRQALRSPDVTNVIVVSHALSSGQLVDSLLGGYPRDFFSELSPGLFSLSIYSCYGPTVRTFHALKDHLSRNVSSFGGRLLSTVVPRNFMGRENVTPVLAFNEFLAEVDRRLGRVLHPSRLPIVEGKGRPFTAAPVCRVRLQGLAVSEGEFGVFLNTRFIGAIGGAINAKPFPATAPLAFDFACDNSLQSPEVLVRSLSITKQSALEVAAIGVSAEVERAGETLRLDHPTPFFRADGTLKALRLRTRTPQ